MEAPKWLKGIVLGAGIAASNEAQAQDSTLSTSGETEAQDTVASNDTQASEPVQSPRPPLSSSNPDQLRARMEASRARSEQEALERQERLRQPQERVYTQNTANAYRIYTENGEQFFETIPVSGQERGQRVALKDHLGNNLRPNETTGYQVELNGEWVDVAQFIPGPNGELIALPVSPIPEMQYRVIDAGDGIEIQLIDPNATPAEQNFNFTTDS
jgi:hypothetical protein